ncbi:MAG TPA: VWA domain-containing protein [Thermoanaerobaculia bacterium]|nr:VWA domain-containing protein [Thermoanaerobaculia bacterium]
MTVRPAALLLALTLGSVNTPTLANNPEPSGKAATVQRPDPAEPGKLSRRERRERIKNLHEKYRLFLREVEPIMIDQELVTFLILESDAQRDLYIEEFWNRRDPDPRTAYNEYREEYLARLEEAKAEFRHLSSDRARIYMVRGRPAARHVIDCERYLVPIEVWRYTSERRFGSDYYLIFYRPRIGVADYRLWQPMGRGGDDLEELLSHQGGQRGLESVVGGQPGGAIWLECRDGEQLLRAINWVQQNQFEVVRMFEPPEIEMEDVAKILRSVVLSSPNAPKIEAAMEVRYPGRRGARTSTEFVLTVEKAALGVKELEGARFYNVDVTGEVLKNDRLFENFRYRYDFPADAPGDSVSVVIERFLRPADYKARIKVIDVNSGGEAIVEKDLGVPYIRESEERRRSQIDGEATVSRLHGEFRTGESQLRIIPLGTDILTGLQQIETIVTGEAIQGVEFYLDGTKVMTKRRPPYTLELDFGKVPKLRRVKAIGLDEKGEFVTGDEIAVNIGSDPFRVWIEQPRVAIKVEGTVRVEVDARAPEGQTIERVELWLNEARVATLFERPYVQSIQVPADLEIGYLRAVAYLADAEAQPVEDVVFLNTPAFLAEIDVHLVELPTTVLRNGKPVQGLVENAFRVLDGGTQVEISKFEYVQNLPLSIGMAIDSSGSMQARMLEAQKAGAQFFKNVLRPGDRAFVVAFDSQAYTVQKWSPTLSDLHAGLSSLRAEETTALYDALVYSLYHFQGVKGQRALVLISDGKDTASKFTFEQVLEYARRAAVPIYAVGIGIRAGEMDVRYKLNQLARETGGNSYFIDAAAGLGPIYNDIENELRAQYVLGFYPPEGVKPGGDWRQVEVLVSDGTAKTIRGYYP